MVELVQFNGIGSENICTIQIGMVVRLLVDHCCWNFLILFKCGHRHSFSCKTQNLSSSILAKLKILCSSINKFPIKRHTTIKSTFYVCSGDKQISTLDQSLHTANTKYIHVMLRTDLHKLTWAWNATEL